MNKALTEKVSFDFVRYANCWEDADILLKGLEPQPGAKFLSIGSAGDNSFSLLTTDPELVVAVDVSKPQLYLIEFKKICIQQLSDEQLLAFLGFKECENRAEIFDQLKGSLSDQAKAYWIEKRDQIVSGIINQGKFERYFQLFSKRILPWIHSKKDVEALLKQKIATEQEDYYNKKWNTWRWRLLFRIFFSKYVMGKFGRDPEFLNEVKVSVGDYIFMKAGKHLQSVEAQNNFILKYNLCGTFGNILPHYLQPENLAKIRSNIDRLVVKEGYAQDAIKDYGMFRYMNLSNIFEYMPPELFEKTAHQLIEGTERNGRLAYWNLMVPRRISGLYQDKVTYLKDVSKDLTEVDKGFFYNQFIVDEVK